MRFESARFPQMTKECTYLCRGFPTLLKEDGGSAPMAPAHLQLGDVDTTDHERAGYPIEQYQWREQISSDRNRAEPQSAADGVEVRRNHHDADQHRRGRDRGTFEVLDLAGSVRQFFGRHVVAR